MRLASDKIATPMAYIRRVVFNVDTQAEWGRLVGVSQMQVWRWEHGLQGPSWKVMRRIEALAKRRRLPWDNNYFFAVPRQKKLAA